MGLLNYFNVKVDKKSHFLALFCQIGSFCSYNRLFLSVMVKKRQAL